MLWIKKRDTKQVFKAIAHQQGVSVSEVKERIQSTIDEMYYSDDPDVQAEFSSYFGKKRPTPEEYVYTMATKIKYWFMKNHHFFNLYIKCAGLFLSFFIELNNFCLSRRLYSEGKYKFYLK